MQPFTSDSVSTAPSPSIRPPSENEAGKGIIIHYNRSINCFNPMFGIAIKLVLSMLN